MVITLIKRVIHSFHSIIVKALSAGARGKDKRLDKRTQKPKNKKKTQEQQRPKERAGKLWKLGITRESYQHCTHHKRTIVTSGACRIQRHKKHIHFQKENLNKRNKKDGQAIKLERPFFKHYPLFLSISKI